MPAESTRRWTAREVRDLIAAQPLYTPRYELVDGELLVTPSPALRHQRAIGLLFTPLGRYVEANRIGMVFSSPSDVELAPDDLRQPDLFVVPLDEVKRVYREGNPVRALVLAIEVLSPSTSRNDRVAKRAGYQRHVGEYWIVDLDARLIERWRPEHDRPEILTQTLTWTPQARLPAFELALEPFFASANGDDL